MKKIERKSAVVVITGLLVLGVLTLSTGIGSAQAEAPEVPAVPAVPAVPTVPFIPLDNLFSAPGWVHFEHHHLPTHVANLAGTYSVTNEGFLIPADPSWPITPHQDKDRLVSCQHYNVVSYIRYALHN